MISCKQTLLSMALMACALFAPATQYWWSGDGVNLGGSGTWDTSSARWGTTAVGPFNTVWPNGGGDEAIFMNSIGGAAGTVTLIGVVHANALSFKTNAWTLTGGTLNLGNGAAAITMTNVPANSHQTIYSTLAGSGALTVSGSASYGYGLFLAANNSAFTGKIAVDASSLGLVITNDNALGAVPANYSADAVTLKSGASLVNNAAVAVSLATNRGITVQNDNSVLYNLNSSGTLLLNSPLTGGGKFHLRKGTIFLSSTNNTYKGQLHVYGEENTTVKAGAENVFSHGVGVGHVFLTRWGGTVLLDLNGYSQILPGLKWAGNGAATTRVVDNLAAGAGVELMIGDNNSDANFDGCIRNTAGTLALTKIGTAAQTLTGTNAYSGATTVAGGTLLADLGKSNSVDIRTNVLPAASGLVLGGGTLSVKGATTGASLQAMGSLAVNPGGGSLSITPNGGAGTTLALGNVWTRTVGGTLLVDLSAAGSTLASSPTLTNDIIGGYVFVKDGSGTGFATVSGGNVVRYTGAAILDATVAAANLDGTVNYVVPATVQLTGSAATQTVNTLQIGGATDPLRVGDGKTLVVGAGGILFVNTGWSTINYYGSGRITSSTGDLVVNAAGGDAGFFINLVDNWAQKVSFTKTGLGTLYLGTGMSYSGDTVINQGQLRRTVNLPSGTGKGNVLVNWNGTMELADSANATPVRINGLSQAANNPGGVVQNSSGGPRILMVGNGDADGSFAGTITDSGTNTLELIKVGTGTQTLSGSNTYKGGTTLSNGVLGVSSAANIGGATNRLIFAGGTLRITGTVLSSLSSNAVNWTTFNGGLEIADARNLFTITNALGPGTVLKKTGAGTLTLTGAQSGTLNTDDPSKITFGAGLGFYNLGILSGGTLSPAGIGFSGMVAATNNLTLSGTYIADVANDGSCDTVTAGGNITLATGATLQLVNVSLLNRAKRYTLMTAVGGTVTGALAVNPSLPEQWRVSTTDGKVVVYYVSPGTMVRVY